MPPKMVRLHYPTPTPFHGALHGIQFTDSYAEVPEGHGMLGFLIDLGVEIVPEPTAKEKAVAREAEKHAELLDAAEDLGVEGAEELPVEELTEAVEAADEAATDAAKDIALL